MDSMLFIVLARHSNVIISNKIERKAEKTWDVLDTQLSPLLAAY